MRFTVESVLADVHMPEALKNEKYYTSLLFHVLARVKDRISSGIFRHPTGALLNSIQGYTLPDGLVIYSDKRYALSQEIGVKPFQMWHLLGKVIPIKRWFFGDPEPVTIFRKCTLQSLIAGGWFHPGTEGKHFMRDGIQDALKDAMKIKQQIDAGKEFIMAGSRV